MPRYADAILQTGYAKFSQAPMLDLKYGAQNGPMVDVAAYVSNAAYVKRNLICLMIEAPRGFQDLEGGPNYIAALKALVEIHAQSIDGLNQTLEVRTGDTPVGGGGEIQQDITNVVRTRSEPSFTWVEKYGMPITSLFKLWISSLLLDPSSKYPTIVSNGVRTPRDLLPDYYGMTCLFIEPDPTHTKVVKAWLSTNMVPLNTGDITGRRDLTQDMERMEMTIRFTALTQIGYGVDRFAQSLMDRLNRSGMNPNMQQSAFQRIDPNVTAANVGYSPFLDKEARTRIR